MIRSMCVKDMESSTLPDNQVEVDVAKCEGMLPPKPHFDWLLNNSVSRNSQCLERKQRYDVQRVTSIN